LILLAGCGGKGPLTYAAGEKTPPVPVGREAAPTTEQMLTPPPQGQPDRVDDPVSRSAPRTTDRFNLPPPR
jgi:predicted small lipoprotein YifL